MKRSRFIRRAVGRFKRIPVFALICILIALLYVGYRLAQFVFPIGISTSVIPMPPATLACDMHDESVENARITPIRSATYQQHLTNQPATSANLVRNPHIQTIDPETDTPVGYARIAEESYATYQHLQDADDKRNFLRVVTSKDTENQAIAMGWISDPATIAGNQTYSYSFEYRSPTPVTVSLEFINNEQRTYETAAELPASPQWKRFTGHTTNYQLANAMRFTITSRKTGWLDTRSYDIHAIGNAELPKALVSVAFDDGWQSISAKAAPLLKKYGVRTTQYIISEASDKRVGSYMDIYAIKDMKRDGHEIASHSLMHCDQTRLSEQEVTRNAEESKAILERHALGPITSFAYPYGQYSATTQQAMAKSYQFIRASDFGYNDRYFDPQNIRSIAIHDTTTDQEFKSWLDYAIAHKLWVVLVYHRVDEQGAYNVSSTQLERQLQIIKNSGLTVLPITDAAKSISQ